MIAKLHNMRVLPVCCLLVLLGMHGTPLFAQSPAVSSDRLGWSQPAGTDELPQLTFGIYVDGSKQALVNASCQPAGVGLYDCLAPFPAMTPGTHTLELVAIRVMGTTILESPKSQPLSVTFVVVPSTPQSPHVVKQ